MVRQYWWGTKARYYHLVSHINDMLSIKKERDYTHKHNMIEDKIHTHDMDWFYVFISVYLSADIFLKAMVSLLTLIFTVAWYMGFFNLIDIVSSSRLMYNNVINYIILNVNANNFVIVTLFPPWLHKYAITHAWFWKC